MVSVSACHAEDPGPLPASRTQKGDCWTRTGRNLLWVEAVPTSISDRRKLRGLYVTIKTQMSNFPGQLDLRSSASKHLLCKQKVVGPDSMGGFSVCAISTKSKKLYATHQVSMWTKIGGEEGNDLT